VARAEARDKARQRPSHGKGQAMAWAMGRANAITGRGEGRGEGQGKDRGKARCEARGKARCNLYHKSKKLEHRMFNKNSNIIDRAFKNKRPIKYSSVTRVRKVYASIFILYDMH
jgi:hypothetical protein